MTRGGGPAGCPPWWCSGAPGAQHGSGGGLRPVAVKRRRVAVLVAGVHVGVALDEFAVARVAVEDEGVGRRRVGRFGGRHPVGVGEVVGEGEGAHDPLDGPATCDLSTQRGVLHLHQDWLYVRSAMTAGHRCVLPPRATIRSHHPTAHSSTALARRCRPSRRRRRRVIAERAGRGRGVLGRRREFGRAHRPRHTSTLGLVGELVRRFGDGGRRWRRCVGRCGARRGEGRGSRVDLHGEAGRRCRRMGRGAMEQ